MTKLVVCFRDFASACHRQLRYKLLRPWKSKLVKVLETLDAMRIFRPPNNLHLSFKKIIITVITITVMRRSISNSAKHINCSRNWQQVQCIALHNLPAAKPCYYIATCRVYLVQSAVRQVALLFRTWEVRGWCLDPAVLQSLQCFQANSRFVPKTRPGGYSMFITSFKL